MDKVRGGIPTALENCKKALRSQNIKVTSNPTEEFQLLHLHTPDPKSLLVAKQIQRTSRKVIMSTHMTAEDFKGTFKFSEELSPIFRRYLGYVYSHADALISPTSYTKHLLRNRYNLPQELKIHVVSNGVDVSKVRKAHSKTKLRKKYGVHEPTVIMVGHVMERKGVSTFLKMSQEFPECDFLWFGMISKSYEIGRSTWRTVRTQHNLTFTGYIDDISEAYSAGDIFLFPSFEENQGIAILEAAANGLPIVVRDLKCYKGWLNHGKNCLKADNEREFIDAIRILIKDEKLRNKLEENAKKLSEKHSLQNVGKKLKEIYKETLS